MKKSTALFFLAVLIFAAFTSCKKKDDPAPVTPPVNTTPADNFKFMKTGNEWKYDITMTVTGFPFPLTFSDGGTLTIVSESGSDYTGNMRIQMDLSLLGFGNIDTTIVQTYYKQTNLLSLISANNDTIPYLKASPAVGDTVGDPSFNRVVTGVDVSVSVPAGNYQTVKMEGSSFVDPGSQATENHHYEDGMIKFESNMMGYPFLMELSSKNY